MKRWFWRRATSYFVRATVTIVSLVMLLVQIVQLRDRHRSTLHLDYCLKNNFRYIRRVVLVITVACESENKQCLKQIQQELNESTINPHLPLLSLLPDVPHAFKNCKVSFCNWYLQLINELGCLSIFCTLRNRADHDVRKNVKSFLKINDYFRNRDHQNPIGVLGICNPEFLTYIVNLGSLILCFMVLCVYLIIFVKQVFYRNLVVTKHFVEILTILWTFALYEILLISMDQTRKWLSLDKKSADQGKVFSKLHLV